MAVVSISVTPPLLFPFPLIVVSVVISPRPAVRRTSTFVIPITVPAFIVPYLVATVGWSIAVSMPAARMARMIIVIT
jgi:hypothetical protein